MGNERAARPGRGGAIQGQRERTIEGERSMRPRGKEGKEYGTYDR
jgi:hypothetical protein